MAENPTATPAIDEAPTTEQRRAAMLEDWRSGMRQVDIARKHGCSQAYVSRLIGSSPRSTADWRARCLLAQALLNHRATPAGLSADDVTALRGALTGEWDKAVA